jgi:hypothetical protein
VEEGGPYETCGGGQSAIPPLAVCGATVYLSVTAQKQTGAGIP